jgi:hypothetical protein
MAAAGTSGTLRRGGIRAIIPQPANQIDGSRRGGVNGRRVMTESRPWSPGWVTDLAGVARRVRVPTLLVVAGGQDMPVLGTRKPASRNGVESWFIIRYYPVAGTATRPTRRPSTNGSIPHAGTIGKRTLTRSP